MFQFFLYDLRIKAFHDVPDGLICGRKDGTLLFQNDSLLSRRHCQFTVIRNEIYLEDFGGSNPSRVNSVPIQAKRKRRLRLGDLVEIGSQRFLLTHQNKIQLGTLTDQKTDPKMARRKSDGSLTLQLSKESSISTQTRTLISLSRSQFKKMKTQRAASHVAVIVGFVLGSASLIALAAWIWSSRVGVSS